jgi:hypothetical protein
LPEGRLHLRPVDWYTVAGLAAATLLTRIVLWPALITQPEGAQIAWALQRFDVTLGHPPAPGALLFLAGARLLSGLGVAPATALLLTTALLSVVAVGGLYLLALAMFGRRVALAAGLLLLWHNGFWSAGLRHDTVVAGAAGMVLVALAGYRAWREPRSSWPLYCAALVGGAGGLQPPLLLLAAPLWLWCCRRTDRRQLLQGLGLVVGLTAFWLVIGATLTGSFDQYAAAGLAQWREVLRPASVLGGAGGLLAGGSPLASLGWLPFAVYGAGRALRLDYAARDQRVQLIWLLLLPPFLGRLLFPAEGFAAAVAYAPGLALLAGLGVNLLAADAAALSHSRSGARRNAAVAPLALGLSAACVLNFSAFLIGPGPALNRAVESLQARLDYLQRFERSDTVLVQSDVRGDYEAVSFYLPRFQAYLLESTLPRPRESLLQPGPILLGEDVRRVVFLNPDARVQHDTNVATLEQGARLRLLELAPGRWEMHSGSGGVWFTPLSLLPPAEGSLAPSGAGETPSGDQEGASRARPLIGGSAPEGESPPETPAPPIVLGGD